MAQRRMLGAIFLLFSFFTFATFVYTARSNKHTNIFLFISRRHRFIFSNYAHPLNATSSQSPSTCHFWEGRLAEWRQSVLNSTSATVIALPKVHGFGDRLSTVYSSFVYAMKHKLRLEIQMAMLPDVFEPIPELSGVVKFVEPSTKRCASTATLGIKHDKGFCSLVPTRRAKCLVNRFSRTCLSPADCEELVALYGQEMSAVHSIGCPLSMLFRFKPEFLKQEILMFIDGNTQTMTIEAARDRLSSYALIAVHIRTGDDSFESRAKDVTGNLKKLVKDFEGCIHSVTGQLSKEGKQVKWIIASDHEAVRSHFRDTFPDRVVSLMAKPKHLLAIKYRGGVTGMLAEWYLISKADEIVLNTFEDTTRLSAFSKFAWLASHKASVHVASEETKGGLVYPACMRRDIHYGGNTITTPKACKGPTTRRNKALLLAYNMTV